MNEKRGIYQRIFKPETRFLALAIILLLMTFTSPLIEGSLGVGIIEDILYLFVIAGGVYAVSGKRHHAVVVCLLAIPFLASIWINYLVVIPLLKIFGNFSGIALFVFMIVQILRHIISRKEVTADVIYGAVVCYLLIAYLWANIYSTLELIEPGSFKFPEGDFSVSRFRFTYFSFVTLTTLGYGDVTPLTPIASSISILEAVIGQLFLVIGVAWLVGMYVSVSQKKREKKEEDPPSGGNDP